MLGRCLARDNVVDFATRVKLRDYASCSAEQQSEVAATYDRAIGLLRGSTYDRTAFDAAVGEIVGELFGYEDQEHWLQHFHDYDRRPLKFQHEFGLIAKYVIGETILDVGCGAGHLALTCARKGYAVATVDVLDYRADEARGLPFRLMDSPSTIPHRDAFAGTALVFSVLHHVDPEDLSSLLAEIRRISSRVIVREDVYDIPLEDPVWQNVAERDELLKEFATLPLDDQARVLELLDYFSNVFERGVVDMDFPFEFKGVSEWQRLFDEHGFRHEETVLIGFEREAGSVGTCHALFVLDAIPEP